MKTKLKITVVLLASLLICFNSYAQKEKSKSKIQVALILDTSNSMDGLIDQAKTQLWTVVNELATAKYAGERPNLEIALYEYGNDGLQSSEGYLRKVSELTTDLDKISEDLFSLKTNGGYEYCGYVIDKATVQLNWSKSDKDLKMIFIAGNEEFTQGSVDYKKACKAAITKGIVVNTIFCGNNQEGINTKWKDGADLADGKYMNIDQNKTIAYIESPFDDEITKLSSELNSTYVAFGSKGKQLYARQSAQDMNAKKQNKYASVNRAVSKSSGAYKNSSWDLVDAAEDEEVEISEIKKEDLPDEMKTMSNKEKEVYLKKKKEDRGKIQEKIQLLNKKRQTYVTKIKKEKAKDNSLGDVMIETVREQAKKKNYTFDK